MLLTMHIPKIHLKRFWYNWTEGRAKICIFKLKTQDEFWCNWLTLIFTGWWMITQFKSKQINLNYAISKCECRTIFEKTCKLRYNYSLNIYHSLVHTPFCRLTYKVTFIYGFNSLAWEIEISRPSWVSNLILAYFMKTLHFKSKTFECPGYLVHDKSSLKTSP